MLQIPPTNYPFLAAQQVPYKKEKRKKEKEKRKKEKKRRSPTLKENV